MAQHTYVNIPLFCNKFRDIENTSTDYSHSSYYSKRDEFPYTLLYRIFIIF